MEIQPDKWDFRFFDRAFAEMERKHINILPILHGKPAFVSSVYNQEDKWKRYVTKVVSRYRGRIHAYEVWNEQNSEHFWKNSNPQIYARFLRNTAKAIRSADPDAKVVYGGTAGIPFDFIEKSFQAGADFDIMNVHPYQLQGGPEQMIPELNQLHRLMAKYGFSKCPLWITEIGWPTAQADPMITQGMPLFLKRLNIDPETPVAVISDPEETGENPYQYDDGKTLSNRIVKIKLRELDSLDIKQFPVLIPCIFRAFPKRWQRSLLSYVRRGGTLLLASGGAPLFWESCLDHNGILKTKNSRFLEQFHIAVEGRWGKDGIPANKTKWILAPDFSKIKISCSMNRLEFLTDSKLRPGDEMIPILYGERGNFKGVSGAIYKLNSDLHGNVIVLCNSRLMNVSDNVQAQLIARTLLIAQACKVERVFPYQIHQSEKNRFDKESYFGLFTHNLSEKKAAAAYRTVVRFCPPGSTRPVLTRKGELWTTEWITPSREKTTAMWSTFHPIEIPVKQLKFRSFFDMNGHPILLKNGNLTVSGAPVYMK